MGHHGEPLPTYNHRETLLLQRRLMSFLLISSVLAVAFVLLIASVQTREASCQTRSNMAQRVLFAHSSAANGMIISEIAAALRQQGIHAVVTDDPPAPPGGKRLETLDTTTNTLTDAGFRLLRVVSGREVLWQLRYIHTSLCQSQRKIAMEALPNVDYERVSYRAISVVNNDARVFLYQTNVITKDKERIKTFPQLQSLFPGFNALVAPPRMTVTNSLLFFTNFSSDLYYGSTPMDVELRIEEWKRPDGKNMYWRIVISSSNVLSEQKLKEIYNVLFGMASTKGFLCTRDECGDSYEDVFLQ